MIIWHLSLGCSGLVDPSLKAGVTQCYAPMPWRAASSMPLHPARIGKVPTAPMPGAVSQNRLTN